MLLESRIRRIIGELSGKVQLPLALELWNGERYDLSPSPTVTLRVPSAGALRYLIKPNLAKLGEAYVEGHLEVRGPIPDALRAAEGLASNLGDSRIGRLPLLRRHSKQRDAEAIRYHYDVSNDFYALWLDRNMVYSCAYSKHGDEAIHTAPAQKHEHIFRQLCLTPGGD